MKSTSLVVIAAAVIAGCSVNGSTPVTAWGKKDVSMLDYRTDGGQCAVIAASGKQATPDGSKQAGGINGANGGVTPQAASGSASSGSAGNSGGSASTPNTSAAARTATAPTRTS